MPTEEARRPVTRLKGLRLIELSAVDRGANPYAHILLCKRDEAADDDDAFAKGPGADALNQALDMGDAMDAVAGFRSAVCEVLDALCSACERIQDDDGITDKAGAIQEAVQAALAALPGEVEEDTAEGGDEGDDGDDGDLAGYGDMAKADAPDPFGAMVRHAGRLKRRLARAKTVGHVSGALARFYANSTGILAGLPPNATPPATPGPQEPDPNAVAKAVALLRAMPTALGKSAADPSRPGTTDPPPPRLIPIPAGDGVEDPTAASPAAVVVSGTAPAADPTAAGDGSDEGDVMAANQPDLAARVAELQAALDVAKKENERLATEKKAALETAEVAKAEASVVATMKAEFEEVRKALDEARTTAQAAEAIAKAERERREYVELLKQAADEFGYLGRPEDVAKRLAAIRKVDDEQTRGELLAGMRQTNEALAALTVEKGRRGEPVAGTAEDEFQHRVAKMLADDPKLSAHDATKRIMADPVFAKKYADETRGGRH